MNEFFAEPRVWHDVCLTMTMGKRLRRLFTIKTRFEAFLVTYAIAVGAAERARHYLETYGTGASGIILALACTGVVFIAGAKLLDSVKRDQADGLAAVPLAIPAYANRHARRPLSRNRPRSFPTNRDGASRSSLRKD